MDHAPDLPLKLDMMLKAASMSRVSLAQKLGVDKSLVGRWLSGSVHPTEHNLSRLSALFAQSLPGFRLADWYANIEDLAQRLGLDLPFGAATAHVEPILGEFQREASGDVAVRAAPYEGFWRTSRPSLLMPGELFHDFGIIRRVQSGGIEVRMGGSGLDFSGHLFPFAGNIIVYLFDRIGRSPVTVMCKGVSLPRAMTLDGIIMLAALDSARTPAALPLIVERVGDLSGDRASDDARHAQIMAEGAEPLEPLADDAIRERVYRPSGPGKGSDAFLSVTPQGSLSRGTTGHGLVG